jgi:hypothetical protein
MDRLCSCFSGPPPPSGTRAARCMVVPGGKAFFAWLAWWEENQRMINKLKAAVQAMANVPVKRGLNQWARVCEAQNEARRKLRQAVLGIINAKIRKSFGKWSETCAAVNAKKAKIRAAVAMLSPEGRAKRAAFQRIAWIRKRNLAMGRAAAGFRLSGCRHALHVMAEQLMRMQKLRKGGAAFFMRKTRACWNVWAEVAGKAAARKRKLAAAATRMTPEGRAMLYGFARWHELLDEVNNLRRALSGFVRGSEKKALTAWIEATFAVRAVRASHATPCS